MSLWISVGALIVVALALLIWPLWASRGENSALTGWQDDRRWPAWGLLGVLPAATVGLYLYLGAPTILQEQALTTAQSSHDADGMLKALEAKLKSQPNDAEGWYALGRSYIALQRFVDAEKALAKSAELAPKEAKMLAQYAEAIALKTGSLQGRPMELVMQALDIDYEEEKALELAGLAAFQQEKWAESLHFWRRLLKKLPKDNEFYEAISQAVKIAEQKSESTSGLGPRAKLAPPEPQAAPH